MDTRCPNPMRHRAATRSTAVTATLLLALAGGLACGERTVGIQPDAPEQLLFLSTRDAAQGASWTDLAKEIYRINADGTGAENVTRSPVQHYRSLSLSRDGSTLAYIRMAGCYGVWVMNADGSGKRELAGEADYRCIHRVRIAPDGGSVAFTSSRDRLGWALWVVNIDGSNPRNVSTPLEETGLLWAAAWSPDGRLAFHHTGTGEPVRTYVVNADGSGRRLLLERAGDHSPAWSPDGSQIAFISDRDGAPRVHIMNADGTGVRRLSDLSGDDMLAHPWDIWTNDHSPWSPDGRSIAFTNALDGGASIYIVAADGGAPRRLTEPQLNGSFNGWSRDGQRIAFTRMPAPGASATRDVYVVNADGTGLKNLTASSWNDSDALWLPR
jgi:TolB protein